MADPTAGASSAAEQGRTWVDGALAPLTMLVPFGVALSRAASGGQWRGDLPAVRDLGLVAVGFGGGASTLVTQALTLIPLGPKPFRAALGSVIALAVAGRLLYALVRRVLAVASPSPRLGAVLAFVATLTVTLSPTWQGEATIGGGAMPAVAAALATLVLGLDVALGDARGARLVFAVGACAAVTLAESPPAALAVTVALSSAWAVRRFAGDARELRAAPRLGVVAALGASAPLAALLAPLALRPFAPRAFADVGRVLSASSLSALDVQGTGTSALAAWSQEIGVVTLALAAAGAALAVVRPRTRAAAAPFLAVLALDTLVPARIAGVLSADTWTPVRALAIASIALGSALGVHAVVTALLRAKIPMAKSAAVLVVMFHFTLVALTSEEAGFAADRSEQAGADAWTDEAFERLAPSAAVLVRSPALAWRLWAARLTRGARPDVLIIPAPLLDRGSVASSLLERRRDTEPLLRSFALTGEPSEFALSKLADVHPLYVELDRAWSKRIVSHLSTAGLWLEYAAQPLGPSDRKASNAASLAPARRMLAVLASTPVRDPPTAAALADALRADASVLFTLGDGAAAEPFLERAAQLAELEPFVLTRTLPYAMKGLKRRVTRPKPEPTSAPRTAARAPEPSRAR
ncbi:MAG TPA: hypothetical protein VGM56_05940 [Byssovorax sp.]